MDRDIKIEARNQFLKYFRFWFLGIGILAVIALVVLIANVLNPKGVRQNDQAPVLRVYDEANVLTDEEEDSLRNLIAETEELIKADIVLVTSNRIMEGEGAVSGSSWETNMMNTADDFYDQKGFGYNKPQGDGVLILDNWYEGQAGSWVSTCGSMIEKFGTYQIDQVLDAIYYGVEEGAYEAYRAAIEEVGFWGTDQVVDDSSYWLGAFVIATVSSAIFIFVKLRNKQGEKTVAADTYVEGRPITNVSQDQFIRKVVTRRHIPRQTSGGGSSGRSSGGGGSHRSSGGVSHGGGGRRR